MNTHKICCIFNYPPHYRKAIYEIMDAELKCDFYFGNEVPGRLEEMKINKLKGYQKRFKNYIWKNKIIWQSDILILLFKPYKSYILSVDTACISSWIFVYLSRLLGKKIYFWTHGTYGRESFFNKLKNKLFFLPASGLFLYGNYAKQILTRRGYNRNKMFVIANSLDYTLNLHIRKQLKKTNIYNKYFKNSYPTLLFIGRLERKKKLDLILNAIYELKKEGILLNVIFIGKNNNYKNELNDLSKKLNIEDNTWFYGACYDEYTIGSLIHNAEICISPGNVGLTAIHSLSYGTPVITHSNYEKQMPEFESITPDKNGLFFEEDNLNSLCDSIKQWLTKHPSKDKELIYECYKIIDEKYNPYYQIDVLKKVLN